MKKRIFTAATMLAALVVLAGPVSLARADEDHSGFGRDLFANTPQPAFGDGSSAVSQAATAPVSPASSPSAPAASPDPSTLPAIEPTAGAAASADAPAKAADTPAK